MRNINLSKLDFFGFSGIDFKEIEGQITFSKVFDVKYTNLINQSAFYFQIILM